MHLFIQTAKRLLCPSLSAQAAVCASQGDFGSKRDEICCFSEALIVHPLKICPAKDVDVVTVADASQDVWITADRL